MTASEDKRTVRERRGSDVAENGAADSGAGDPFSAAPPLVTTHAGRYAGGDEIARGGMGRVIEATDTLLGRVVALKEALITDADALRRFARETRITARLEHPSIVPVYDAGTSDDGLPYYVMRKVSGLPLDQLIEDRQDDLGRRLALLPHVLAAAQAVAHAHSRGVIHRDLKPTNILVGAFGETVLIDWGLAKVIGEPDDLVAPSLDAGGTLRTRYGAVLGTPGFMPPEQLLGTDVDKPADVYALGATLYYLLACKPPHDAATADAMMVAAVAGPPVPIATRVPGVPRELSTIVDKALAYESSTRYADAAALAEDLSRFLAGRLVSAHQYSRREQLVRFVRRHRAPLTVATVGVAILSVGAWFAVGRVLDARIDASNQQQLAASAREQASERDVDLAITRARVLLDTDAALALAQLTPLADSDRWREVRDLAADARSRGIARRLPGSPTTHAIALADDGRRAASVGDDGIVRVYDLPARTSRIVANVGHGVSIEFLDGDHLLVNDFGALGRLDLVSGTRTAIVTAAPAEHVTTAAGGVAWIDREHHVFRLAVGAQTPVAIPLADTPRVIALADNGTRLAIAGAHSLWLVDDAGPEMLIAQPAFELAWAPGGHHLAAQLAGNLADLGIGDDHPSIDPVTEHGQPHVLDVDVDLWKIQATQSIAYAGGLVAEVGFGWLRTRNGELDTRFASDATPLDLFVARGNLLVTAVTTGEIFVFDGTRRQQLTAPVDNMQAITGNSHSPYLIAIVRGHLFVWDLEECFGRAFPSGRMSLAMTAGFMPHQMLVERGGLPASWIDLATGASVNGPVLPELARPTASPSGDSVVAITGDREMSLLRPGMQTVDKLADGVLLAAFVDDRRIAIATARGIELFSLDTRRADPLVDRPATTHADNPAVELRAAGPWLYAALRDQTVMRVELATGRTQMFARPLARAAWTVGVDGRAWIADDTRVMRWELDGQLTLLATVSSPIDAMVGVVAGRVAIDTEQGGVLVAADAPSAPVPTIPLGSMRGGRAANESAMISAQLAKAAGLIVIPATGGGATVLDVVNGESWIAARNAADADVGLAKDGTAAYQIDDVALRVWTTNLPTTRAATARWLDELTAPYR